MTASEWQAYVNRLGSADAQARSAVYQTVPDRTRGDAGLEGFSSDGHAFQAYYPEPDKTPAQLKTALCSKITQDLAKLHRFRNFWESTLHDRPLRFWRLLVPEKSLKDKNVVRHAAEKGTETRALGLPFIAKDFQALVCTPSDFPQALAVLHPPNGEFVSPPEVPIGDSVLRAFEYERAEKVRALDEKLGHIPKLAEPRDREKFRRNLLDHYLAYQNALEWLGNHYPETREDIITKREGVRKSIETQNFVSMSQPPERLRQAQADFKAQLDQVAPYLESTRRDRMSWGVVTEWLLECPLDFQP